MTSKLSLLPILVSSITFAQAPPLQWQQVHGGTASDAVSDLTPTSDGGWIMAGFSRSMDGDLTNNQGEQDGWLVKLNSVGDIEWQRSYGGSGNDVIQAVCVTPDGYLAAGYSDSNDGDVIGTNGSRDAWLLRVTTTGDLISSQPMGGASSERFSAIAPSPDGGFIAVGYSDSSTGGDLIPHYGGYDGYLVKISSMYSIEWQRIIGHTEEEDLRSVAATADGGFIISGVTRSGGGGLVAAGNHGNYDVWVLKVDATGSSQWQRVIGGSDVEDVFDLIITNDGGYLISGQSSSNDGDIPMGHGLPDALLVKLAANGDTQWVRTYGGTLTDGAHCAAQLADGSYLFVGNASSTNGDVVGQNGLIDIWLVKTDVSGNLEWQECYGGTGADRGQKVRVHADGSVIIAGISDSQNGDVIEFLGGWDCWLMKTGTIDVGILEGSLPDPTIAPNPTTGTFSLQSVYAIQNAVITITDMHGHVVETTSMNGLAKQMDLTGHTAGAYLVTVEKNGSRSTYPLLLTPLDR